METEGTFSEVFTIGTNDVSEAPTALDLSSSEIGAKSPIKLSFL